MSLADLKKKNHTKIKQNFSIDEFIDDANNYALGKPEIVSSDIQKKTSKLASEIASTVVCADNKPFKHATFTLSEDIIGQLNNLANETNISKSRLLRILVNDFYHQENPVALQLSKVK